MEIGPTPTPLFPSGKPEEDRIDPGGSQEPQDRIGHSTVMAATGCIVEALTRVLDPPKKTFAASHPVLFTALVAPALLGLLSGIGGVLNLVGQYYLMKHETAFQEALEISREEREAHRKEMEAQVKEATEGARKAVDARLARRDQATRIVQEVMGAAGQLRPSDKAAALTLMREHWAEKGYKLTTFPEDDVRTLLEQRAGPAEIGPEIPANPPGR